MTAVFRATPTDWLGNPIGDTTTIVASWGEDAVVDTGTVPTGSVKDVLDWVEKGSIAERAKLAYAAEHSRDHPSKPGKRLAPRKSLLEGLDKLLSEGRNDG